MKMQINKMSFAAGAGSIVLLGAALLPGLAGAQTAGDTPSPRPSTTTAAAIEGERHARGPGARGGLHVGEDLAAILGVTVEDLRAAAETAKESLGEVERPITEEGRDALKAQVQAAFASALGLPVADLEAATAQLKAKKQAEAIARVNEKVADGTLTQEQADAIIERIESGEHSLRGDRSSSTGRGFGRFGGFGGPGSASPPTPDA